MKRIKFAIHDKVRLKELEWHGIIKTISIQDLGITYEVRYFWNGEPKYAFFYEDELEKIL